MQTKKKKKSNKHSTPTPKGKRKKMIKIKSFKNDHFFKISVVAPILALVCCHYIPDYKTHGAGAVSKSKVQGRVGAGWEGRRLSFVGTGFKFKHRCQGSIFIYKQINDLKHNMLNNKHQGGTKIQEGRSRRGGDRRAPSVSRGNVLF